MPLFFSLMAGVLIVDQATKILVRTGMPLGTEIPVLPFFSITYVDNTGIAFGLFQQRNLMFIAVGLVVSAFLIYYAIKLLPSDRASALAMGAILGGAAGNLVDRIVYGHVTDFLDFYAGPHHWPVFNVADSAICVGAVFVGLRTFFEHRGGAAR